MTPEMDRDRIRLERDEAQRYVEVLRGALRTAILRLAPLGGTWEDLAFALSEASARTIDIQALLDNDPAIAGRVQKYIYDSIDRLENER